MKLAMRLISSSEAKKWFAEHGDDELGKKRSPQAALQKPEQFELYENYPNPFNPRTTISFDMPVEAHVQLDIYNIRGRLVQRVLDENKDAGHYTVHWNARNHGAGVYFFEMRSGQFRDVKKMLLVK